MTDKPTTPRRLKRPGRQLWSAVVSEFEMAEHELAQLEEACRVRDRLSDLRDTIDRDGIMISSSQGARLHPAIPEIRQQQLALARLLATLNVPAPAQDNLPAARGVRGVYTGTRYRSAQ